MGAKLDGLRSLKVGEKVDVDDVDASFLLMDGRDEAGMPLLEETIAMRCLDGGGTLSMAGIVLGLLDASVNEERGGMRCEPALDELATGRRVVEDAEVVRERRHADRWMSQVWRACALSWRAMDTQFSHILQRIRSASNSRT